LRGQTNARWNLGPGRFGLAKRRRMWPSSRFCSPPTLPKKCADWWACGSATSKTMTRAWSRRSPRSG